VLVARCDRERQACAVYVKRSQKANPKGWP
jgi:hypothetical protein